jgi:hypothetical protein
MCCYFHELEYSNLVEERRITKKNDLPPIQVSDSDGYPALGEWLQTILALLMMEKHSNLVSGLFFFN